MNLNTGIGSVQAQKIGGILNRILSDSFVLYIKTRNYHWNVTGPHFIELHKLFESQYEQLDASVDAVAERARALGALASGSMKEFIKQATLGESAGEARDWKEMVRNLLADHEAVIRALRKDVETTAKLGDAGTSDFLTGLLEEHEKTAWILRAYLP